MATTFNWKRVLPSGDLTVTAGTLADNWLAHLNTAITAASGDADAYWEVVSYVSVSPKSLLLRPKNGNPGRIVIFGQNGSTANAAAVRAASISQLYIGFHATSTSNTVDASWLTTQPLSGTDYMPAVLMWQMVADTTFRLTYLDSEAGMFFLITRGTATSFAIAGAGWLIEDPAGTEIPTICGTGSTLKTSAWGHDISAGVIPGMVTTNSGYSLSNPSMVGRYNGFDETLYRIFTFPSGTGLQNATTKRAFFFPIHLCFSDTDLRYSIFGKLRQVAFGPRAVRESSLEATAGSPSVFAYAHTYHNATPQDAIWFTNFGV